MEEEKKLKAYISGPITGHKDAYKHFADAEKELIGFDFIPVNPFNNPDQTDPETPYTTNLLHGIAALSGCNIIYMLEGWQTSRGSRIEYSFAVNMGIEIMFESVVEMERNARIRDVKIIDAIRNAIHEVMNMPFEVLSDRTDRTGFFGRMVFCRHAYVEGGMTTRQIARYIQRDEATVRYCLKKYDQEFSYNKVFRQYAERIDDVIKELPIPPELYKRKRKYRKLSKKWKNKN